MTIVAPCRESEVRKRRRRRKKENGKGPKSFQSLIGFDRPSYKYASQISERRRKGVAAGGGKGFGSRPSYKGRSHMTSAKYSNG